jgi:hypothetical protein
MELTFRLRAAESISGGYKFYIDYTYYLCPDLKITIGGNDYVVTGVSENNWITVTGDTGLTVGNYTIRNPHFKNGKYLQYIEEFTQEFRQQDESLKSPFVYNVETQTRTQPPEVDSIIDSEGDMRFLVYNGEDIQERTIEKSEEERLNPLHRWIDAFIDALERSKDIHDVLTVTRTNHRFITTKGSETTSERGQAMFNNKYTGIDLVVSLQIKKNLDCPERDIPVIEGDAYSIGYSDGYA